MYFFFKVVYIPILPVAFEGNVIRVSVKNEAFGVTGKKPSLFLTIPSVFLLNRILSNTGIDFANNFQLIKYYSETALLRNFGYCQNFNFGGN